MSAPTTIQVCDIKVFGVACFGRSAHCSQRQKKIVFLSSTTTKNASTGGGFPDHTLRRHACLQPTGMIYCNQTPRCTCLWYICTPYRQIMYVQHRVVVFTPPLQRPSHQKLPRNGIYLEVCTRSTQTTLTCNARSPPPASAGLPHRYTKPARRIREALTAVLSYRVSGRGVGVRQQQQQRHYCCCSENCNAANCLYETCTFAHDSCSADDGT